MICDTSSDSPKVDFSSSDEIKDLKQTLYNLWKFYHKSIFFFIGATIGRVSFKKFYQLAKDYGIDEKDADSFLALQLKHYDYKNLRDSDSCFSDADVQKALGSLKSHTEDVKYLPFICRLKSLKKFFHTPKYITPLGELFLYAAFKYHTTIGISVPESFAREHFKEKLNISDDHFDKQVFELFQVKTYDRDGERHLDLSDLAELEQIIYDEHYKPPMSDEERAFFLDSLNKYPNLIKFL